MKNVIIFSFFFVFNYCLSMDFVFELKKNVTSKSEDCNTMNQIDVDALYSSVVDCK